MALVPYYAFATLGHQILRRQIVLTLFHTFSSFFNGLMLFGQKLFLSMGELSLGEFVVILFRMVGNLNAWAEGALLHFFEVVVFFVLDGILL